MANLVLDWGLFGAYGTNLGAAQSVDTGGIEVTVGFTEEDEGAQAFTFNSDGYVGSGEPFDPNSFLKLFGEGGEGPADDTSTTTLSFSATDDQYADEVQNVSFRINDIDIGRDDTGTGDANHLDMVTIRAYDADGNEVPVTLSLGSDVQPLGSNGAQGGVDAWSPTDAQASALVEIAGPVARIEIDYENNESGAQRVMVSDVHFSTLDSEPQEPDANDDTGVTTVSTAVVVDVLANDTDPQSDPLTIVALSTPSNGMATDNGDGTVTYTPTAGFIGTDTFTYTVADPDGNTDTATVTVTVNDDGPGPNYIVEGTDGDDLIDYDYTGDPEGDLIDHNDNAPGRPPQQDTVLAGDGDDTVFAGEGDDDVNGEDGDDVLYGEEGDDTLIGEDGDDVLRGGEGDDDLRGGDGNDSAYGGIGDDLIDTSGTRPAIDVVTFPGVPVDSDPENDRDLVDAGAGNDTIITGDDRDTILGGDGDDSINSGIDDDEVYGGAGNDFINDVQGADYIEGGDGDDTILAGIDTFSDYVGDDPNLPIGSILSDPNTTDGMDTVYGGAGNDFIQTGDDADWIDGGTGNDTIHAGIDDDTVLGGEGDDSIIGGHGSDSILGGDGDDWINAGDSNLLWGQAPDATDPVPTNGMDTVLGGAGNDTIFGEDDNDSLDGGIGNDVIDGGIDNDVIRGREGDDTLYGQQGADTITGGFGDDVIYGDDTDGALDILDATDPDPDDNRDHLGGRQGNDTIYGGDDDDTLIGGLGDDYLDGGIDEDSIEGGEGDDTIIGGQGADTMYGQSGRDTFIGGNVGDYVDGGSAPDGINPDDDLPYDYDTLDLRGTAPTGGRINITYTSADREDGFVEFFDADGNNTGQMDFYDIENVVPCFTPGTAIATPKGERMVEELKEGDKIITRDNGIQEIRWIGRRGLTGHELARAPHLRPILIQKGALGDNLPEHDILVSPQHRLLLTGDKTQLYFEEREVLAAAKHLTDLPGVDEVGTLGVTYVHFMFDQHEVVLSNGAWSESFQPGANVLDGIGAEQRDEILQLFPELKTTEGVEDYTAARRALKKHEARLLVR